MNTVSNMNICTFKLITGVEIVCELVAETGRGYQVLKPLQVHFLRGQDGSEQMAFAHWIMTAANNQTVHIFDHLLAAEPLPTNSDIADSYRKNTSSIIIPAHSNGQILKS